MKSKQVRSDSARASPSARFPIVGVGASAGGLEAFTALLKALPAKPGCAFVFIQHLVPTQESQLPGLLSRHSAMPVKQAEEAMPVEPNHVYVAPSNADLTINDGCLHLLARSESGPNHLPIDTFLCSLATEREAASIAVILSGTASDGSRGVVAVKAAGGIAFAQDAESSKFAEMPLNAWGTGSVDFRLPPAAIAEEIAQIVQHSHLWRIAELNAQPTPLSETAGFPEIISLLRAATGVALDLYKSATIARRVERRMALTRHDSVASYLRHLRQNQTELDTLREDIFVHATSFFRDPESMAALTSSVLRGILANQQEPFSIRIWTAGCANGEETYSIAMLLFGELGDRVSQASIRIIGTDVSESCIHRARAGVYSESALAEVSAQRRQRFFVKVDQGYQVVKTLREVCLFATHDVTRDPPFSKMHLVSCRNMLVYMEQTLQRRVMEAFHTALNPGGYLFLGNTESLPPLTNTFSIFEADHKIFRRNGFRLPAPTTSRPLEPAHPTAFDLRKELEHLLLEQHTPPAILVGPDLNIVHFQGQTGQFLAPSSDAPSFHILKMLRRELVMDVHLAVRKVLTGGDPVLRPGASLDVGGARKHFDIHVDPFWGRHSDVLDALVVFQEVPGPAGKSKSGRRKSDGDSTGINSTLRREIATLRQDFVTMMGEHDASNAEMTATNQDSLAVNEELQTTIEELETTKEELQSSNEEFVTLNEEMKHRNAELNELTEDLNSLLIGLDIPLVILDSQQRIRRFTPIAARHFNLIAADVGRPFIHMAAFIDREGWDAVVREVVDQRRAVLRECGNRDGSWYSLRVSPHPSAGPEIPGLLVALLDITSAKTSLEEANRARDLAQVAARAKSDFLSSMSHEIRTPMNGIMGMVELLRDTPLSQEQMDLLTTMNGSADALLSILNDILDFSKGEAGKLELESMPFDLRTTLEDVVGLLAPKAREKGVEIALWYPRQLPSWFNSDAGRIRQIVMNLGTNAVKFTNSGYVLFEVGCVEHAAGKAEVTITVHDTGPGIEPEWISLLFQRFSQLDASTTRRHGGTGLGLAISKQLSELLGGTISVTSEVSQGSSFWVRLPLATAEDKRLHYDCAELRAVGCVLLDSHAISRGITIDICSRWGMRIEDAANLPQTVAKLEAARNAGTPYGVAIVDYPDDETSVKGLLHAIRSVEGCAKLPVIVARPVTRALEPQAWHDSFTSHVLKPIRTVALRDALMRIFGPKSDRPISWRSPVTTPIVTTPFLGMNVLVAEDNAVNQKVTMALLAKLGIEATLARDGKEAVRLAGQIRFDLILMDCQMPEMDGFEAAREIRKGAAGAEGMTDRRVPIVAFTAAILQGERDQCIEAGIDAFLAKPVKFVDLRAVIEKYRPIAEDGARSASA